MSKTDLSNCCSPIVMGQLLQGLSFEKPFNKGVCMW